MITNWETREENNCRKQTKLLLYFPTLSLTSRQLLTPFPSFVYSNLHETTSKPNNLRLLVDLWRQWNHFTGGLHLPYAPSLWMISSLDAIGSSSPRKIVYAVAADIFRQCQCSLTIPLILWSYQHPSAWLSNVYLRGKTSAMIRVWHIMSASLVTYCRIACTTKDCSGRNVHPVTHHSPSSGSVFHEQQIVCMIEIPRNLIYIKLQTNSTELIQLP